jgi:hypothetical protein
MLHQKDSVNVKSCEYDRFKKFYGQKVGDDLLLPDASLFTEQFIGTNSTKRKPVAALPHSFIDAYTSNIMHTQLYTASALNEFRSQMNIIPTLEFHLNSCWLESAIGVLFSLPKARGRILASSHRSTRFFRSLFDVMLVYGLSYNNQVPKEECMRCGLYPVENQNAPPILDEEGYNGIFAPGDVEWGSSGDPCEALTRFFKFLDIEPVWTSHDELAGFDIAEIVSDVICVLQFPDGTVTHEILFNVYDVTAVIFGNEAHFFSVCKAVNTPDWTVKDALVQEFTTFPSFSAALTHAHGLHYEQGAELYTVQLAVYVR